MVFLRAFVFVAIGVFALFFAFQRKMIYYPFPGDEGTLRATAFAAGLDPWTESDGKLIGWKTPNSSMPNRLLILHGNAGHALLRTDLIRTIQRTPAGGSCQIFVLEYPGYGAREGKPSEETFAQAAASSANLLRENFSGKLILLGESIGGGVAASAVKYMTMPPEGLLLLTPFDSLVSAARHHYPWLPVGLLLSDKYDTVKNLRGFSGPVSIVIAANDEVVPPKLGKKLHDSLPGPRQLVVAENADHNGIIGGLDSAQWESALAFAMGDSLPDQ